MHILSYIQIQQHWNGHFAKIVNIDLGAIGAINPLVHHLWIQQGRPVSIQVIAKCSIFMELQLDQIQ